MKRAALTLKVDDNFRRGDCYYGCPLFIEDVDWEDGIPHYEHICAMHFTSDNCELLVEQEDFSVE